MLKQVKCPNPITLVLKSCLLVSLLHMFIGIYDRSYLWWFPPLCPQQKMENSTTLSTRDTGGISTLKIPQKSLVLVDLTGVFTWLDSLPMNSFKINRNAVVIELVSPKNDSYNVIPCSEAAWVQNPSALLIWRGLVSVKQRLRYV